MENPSKMSEVIPADQFFEEDDEETLALLLVSSDDDNENILDGLADRFRGDSKGTSDKEFWNTIYKSAEDLGFRESGQSAPSQSPPVETASSSFPAAFETVSGKKHIRATSSFLRISETRAVQLTLSALRSLNGGNDAGETHIQSLLGTRGLLKTVRDYYFHQRLSRLQVIMECLRIEQDDTAPHNEAATSMLDDLDKDYTLGGCKRGLFQRLLTVACAPCTPPTREELLPTLDLRSETPENLQDAQRQYADTNSSSDSFVADCFQASRMQSQRERVEAMEASLVLLYHRIDQGIHRIDYVLILIAFQSCGTFFTAEEIKRLSYLAGLVCAECMGLWMMTSTDTDPIGVTLWVLRHPLLLGVVECDEGALHEIEAILMLLTKYASQVPARKLRGLAIRTPAGTTPNGDGNVVEAPESIALFSFALLLRLVQMHVPGKDAHQWNQGFDFAKHAMECAQIASDDCGVFDYLHATMEALVKTPVLDSFSSVSNVPYDWQFSSDSSPLVLEGPSGQEPLNAASVAYSSIGLELLSSTIIGFQSTIRTGNCISLENVSMLCSLAATVYRNHPLLCDAFWKNLEVYTSVAPSQDGPLTSNQALCYLVDAAHACAASALNAVAFAAAEQHPGLEEDVLLSLVPLLQLMSSLCSSSDMVESALKLLPNGMVRIALLCCAPTSSVKDSTAFSKNSLQVVEAVQRLARVGHSSNCRAMLRSYLEEEGSDVVDGPRVLYRIVEGQQSANIVSSALRIMGYFVENAGGHELWVAKAAKSFGLGENGLSALLTGQSSSVALSALHVLSGFVGNMAVIAFCPLCEESDMLDVLVVAVKGVTASCMLLTTLLSSSSNQSQAADGLSFLVAHGVLRCSAMFLRELRPLSNMHASLRVKAASQEARDILIQTLSTSTPVGQAIAYFASAPVSLSLVIVLEEMLRDANVLQIASDEYARETEPFDFGAWRSIADTSRENKQAIGIAKVRSNGQNLVSNVHELGIDLEGFQARGWTDEATAMEPLHAASAALDLLRLWALTVDEIVAEEHGIRSGNIRCLNQAAWSDLRALGPHRLVFSQITRPPVVEGNRSLRQVWPTDTLSLFEVLIRYLDEADEVNEMGGLGEKVAPSLVAADVISLVLVNAKHFGQNFDIPVADVVVRCALELCFVLNQTIMDVAALTLAQGHQTQEISPEDDMKIRKSLASLRLLSICMQLDARVVVVICSAESSPFDGIVGILNSTASSIRDGTSLEQISADALLTSKLRVTSASIHALLTLWISSCSRNTSQTVSDVVKAFKANVVADLVTLVKFAGFELSATDIPEDPSYFHIRSVLTAATCGALEVLAVELSKELEETPGTDTGAISLVGAMMGASFTSLSLAFSEISAAVAAARSWSKVESAVQSFRHVNVHDPRSILCSFLASYRSPMESHESQENLCDVVAASSCWRFCWRSPLLKTAEESDENILKRTDARFIFLSKQLALVTSWGRFATMFSLAEERAGDNVSRDNAKERALLAIRIILVALGHVATDIEEAQMLVSENYLPFDVGVVANVLAGLLVETLSRHYNITRSSKSVTSSETFSVVEMLVGLNSTIEKLLSSTSLNRPSRHVISLVFPSYLLKVTDKIREDTKSVSGIRLFAFVKSTLTFTSLSLSLSDVLYPTKATSGSCEFVLHDN